MTRQQVAERKARVVAALPASEKVDKARAKTLSTGASLGAVHAEPKRTELDFSYTHITEPIGGIVGKGNAESGQRVAAGDLRMTITPLDNLWVTADYKEMQLRKVRKGDPLTVHLDTYGKDLKGTVQSIGGCTGAKVSALAPENATGNFVKVVQRIPVRIRLDGIRRWTYRLFRECPWRRSFILAIRGRGKSGSRHCPPSASGVMEDR